VDRQLQGQEASNHHGGMGDGWRQRDFPRRKVCTAAIYFMGGIYEMQIPRPDSKPVDAGPGTLHFISSPAYSRS